MAVLITLIFVLSFPAHALACSMCFYGDVNQSAITSLRYGVFSLLILVIFILILFAKFFLDIRRKEQLMKE